MTDDELLTTAQAAALLNIPPGTLRYWRHQGVTGPRSFTMGVRKVMYKKADVLAWIEQQYRESA